MDQRPRRHHRRQPAQGDSPAQVPARRQGHLPRSPVGHPDHTLVGERVDDAKLIPPSRATTRTCRQRYCTLRRTSTSGCKRARHARRSPIPRALEPPSTTAGPTTRRTPTSGSAGTGTPLRSGRPTTSLTRAQPGAVAGDLRRGLPEAAERRDEGRAGARRHRDAAGAPPGAPVDPPATPTITAGQQRSRSTSFDQVVLSILDLVQVLEHRGNGRSCRARRRPRGDGRRRCRTGWPARQRGPRGRRRRHRAALPCSPSDAQGRAQPLRRLCACAAGPRPVHLPRCGPGMASRCRHDRRSPTPR